MNSNSNNSNNSNNSKATSAQHSIHVLTECLFRDLVELGPRNILKPEHCPGQILDLPSLVRVMTRGAYSLRTLEEIKSLTDFVQKRLCVVDYYKPHFESREHMVEVWENGVIASRFHYYDGYKLTDLAQVFPFVMEWFLEQHNTSLNLDKKTDRKAFEASSLMISRLIDRLLANGYKDIQIAKNHKGGQSYYLDFKKLVSVLTSGGTLSHESLSDLYVYLQDKLIDAHEPWYNWLEQRQTKILSKTFIDGEVKHLTIKGHTYYLEELGTLVHIVCDFLLKEKPVLCF